MRPLARTAGALLLSLAAASAGAATCPSTCVTFDAQGDAQAFVTLVAGSPAADSAAFLKSRMAAHAARVMPNGTQFVLLAEHQVPEAKSSYYAIQLPGAATTTYLVAIK